jgi:ABC-type dipeptide/oligopeptide/nickel transport system permease component
MATYILRRFGQGIVVLLIVSCISFLIFQFVGNPVITMAGRYATQAQRAEVRHLLGLDQPFYIQYGHYLWNVLHGNFGMSYVARVPVLGLILERLPASLELAFSAEVIAIVLGVGLGLLAAAYPRSWFNKIIMTGSLFGISLPTFVVGILLILVFAVTLGWLPPSGRGHVVHVIGSWSTGFITLSGLKHLIMPAVTLGMFQLALLLRLTHSGTLEALQTDYIRTAWAKGLGPVKVLFKHTLRNVLIPVVTMIGLQFGQLIGFSIVTETIFQWPGAGNLLLQSIYKSDFPVVAAYLALVALFVVLLNLLVDISYGFLNPRIRYS